MAAPAPVEGSGSMEKGFLGKMKKTKRRMVRIIHDFHFTCIIPPPSLSLVPDPLSSYIGPWVLIPNPDPCGIRMIMSPPLDSEAVQVCDIYFEIGTHIWIRDSANIVRFRENIDWYK